MHAPIARNPINHRVWMVSTRRVCLQQMEDAMVETLRLRSGQIVQGLIGTSSKPMKRRSGFSKNGKVSCNSEAIHQHNGLLSK